MTPTALVEVRKVSLSFVAVQALQEIDLSINQGDIHALVGENGAGKSTLGKVVSGIERPDEGELLINGEARHYTHPREALRDGITTITQEIALLNNQSVLHNVLLGQEICRVGVLQRRQMLAEFERLVELTGFSLDPDERVGRLHMADQRKVEVLQAVARDSRLIIMDEPTAMLADDETRVFLDIVRGLQRSGHTIIYISHFLEEVLELADVVTVMRNGRIVRTAPTADETTHSLVEAMLGRSMLEMYPPRQPRAADAPVVFEVRGLQAPGLGNIDLQLRAGEITGLAGLVGSGRSRLARTLFGALGEGRRRDSRGRRSGAVALHDGRHSRRRLHVAGKPQGTGPAAEADHPQQPVAAAHEPHREPRRRHQPDARERAHRPAAEAAERRAAGTAADRQPPLRRQPAKGVVWQVALSSTDRIHRRRTHARRRHRRAARHL